MSVIIGTWPLSGDFGRVSLDCVASTLRACIDAGFVEFDTAPNYGAGFAEFALGKEVVGLDGVRVNTKCGTVPFVGKRFAPDDLRASVEHSLERLGCERIHTLFLHNPRDEVADYEPILALFDALKAEGTIEKSGISLARGFDYPNDALARFDVIQDDANLLYLDSLRRMSGLDGVEFAARSPLASGILGGHINETTEFAPDDHRAGWLKGDRLQSIVRRVRVIEKMFPLPVPEFARRFLLSHPAVDHVICGVKRPEHVAELAASAAAGPLEAETIDAAEQAWRDDFGLTGERHLGY